MNRHPNYMAGFGGKGEIAVLQPKKIEITGDANVISAVFGNGFDIAFLPPGKRHKAVSAFTRTEGRLRNIV